MSLRISLIILSVLIATVPVFGDYKVSWHTIDAGGGQSTGGPYSLVAR
jgi:hypothetical protein